MAQRRGTMVVGGILILAGIWALLSTLGVPWASMDQLWPAVLALVGVASIVSALSASPRKSDGVWFGVTAVLSGGVMLYITAGPGEWGDMSWLWPAFPIAGGVGWLAAWLVDVRELSTLVTGLIALVVGGLGFAYTYGLLGAQRASDLARLWPIILVVLGIGLILQYVVRRR